MNSEAKTKMTPEAVEYVQALTRAVIEDATRSRRKGMSADVVYPTLQAVMVAPGGVRPETARNAIGIIREYVEEEIA